MAARRVSSGLMHFGDPIIIFVIALILFGPKKLPELARQLAKLMAEFRRASNEFKIQIDEELRSSEQADRQKQISAPVATEPMILPPSVGAPVSQYSYNDPAETERPDRTRDAGWADQDTAERKDQQAPQNESGIGLAAETGATTHSGYVNGTLATSAQKIEIAASGEVATDTTNAIQNEFGGLFKESSLTFGSPSPPAVEGEAVAAIIPADSLPEAALEGSASENAQATIHHG